MLVLHDDPLADIGALRNPEIVIKAGVVHRTAAAQ